MDRRSTPLNNENTLICKTGPSFIYTSLLALTVIFFTELVVLSWPGPTVHMVGEGDQPTPWYVWLIPALFGVFALMGLWYLLGVKFIRLHTHELILIKPFMFYKKSFQLSELISLQETPLEIKSREDGNEITLYSGLQCKVTYNNKRTIKFNQLELKHYTQVVKQLERVKRGLPPLKQHHQDYSGWALYVFLVFVLVLTIGLGYGLWTR